MKKINVLWLVGGEKQGLDNPRDVVTGAQTTTLEILKSLNPNHFSIFLGIDGFSILGKELKKYASIIPFRTNLQFDILALKRLKSIIRLEKIDILHTQGRRHAFLSFSLGKNYRLIRVLTRHIPFYDDYHPKIKKLTYNLFDRCSLKSVDAIVTVAEYGKRRIIETRGIDPIKIRVIYNGIDVERFDLNKINPIQIRKEFSISPKTKVVTTIASLTERKGHKFLFQAASDIVKKFPDTVFLVVGDGYYKKTLKKIVEKRGIQKNVIFTGFRKDVERILRISDVLVLPSLSEGFPDVVLEAMAMKKPVIATKIAGIPEMIDDGKNGFLVPPKNFQKLAYRILEILGNSKLSVLLGKRGYEKIINKFNTKKMAKNYERLYIELYRRKRIEE